MNIFTRGIRNAFRNTIRTFSIVVILGLSLGLALTMLIAHQAVGQKIKSVEGSVGNTVTIDPAGERGFSGGGNPLTTAEINKVASLAHVSSIDETLSDRLTTSNTNLQSSITAGSLGRRFAANSGETFTPPTGSTFGGSLTTNFTPPVTVYGTNDPTLLSSAQGGGTFSLNSGKVFASNSSADVALVGSALASKNNLKVGSTFTAYGTTITVVGIYSTGNTFSNSQLLLPLATEQTLSSQSGDITEAIVNVDSLINVPAVTTAVQNLLGTSVADVTNASAQAQTTVAPLKNIQTISVYSLVGAVIAGSVIILLTMVMIVRERRREIGVTKAIGATNIGVMAQFMVEAVTLTLLGAVIGIIIGFIAGNPITKLLVNNSTNTTTSANFGSAATTVRVGGGGGRGLFGGFHSSLSSIHADIGWSIIGYGLIAALIVAIVGSAIASIVISKIRPAEVMRVE
ncbi:MAG TPA: FtsX-like permease family protein [Candidatus Saccharimonadales bacterium]|jgi:putative ABC transport system permease protein|nr:FtsX-like permease family protein [Candidatus Saccharimonadales bacterium]